MRKISIILMMFLVVSSAIFAAVDESKVVTPFSRVDARSLGMGGVGVVALNATQAIWSNPAALSDMKLQISIPTVGVNIYNPFSVYGLYEDGTMKRIFDGEIEADELYKNENIQKMLKYGYGKIADANAGLSFSAKGFGIGIAVQDSILTYLDGGISSTNIIDQLNAEIRIGYGFKLNFSEKLSLDLGISASFSYLAYNKSIDVATALNIIKGKTEMSSIPIMAGWAVPINLGARLNMPLGFSMATTVRNINGRYHMNANKDFDSWKSSPFGNSSSFDLNTDSSWDVGIAWDPDFSRAFKPTVEADFVDIVGFIQNGDYSARAWMKHLKVGAEINGLWIFDIRAGLDSGYWTLGAGLDLYALRVEAAYYWHEFGSVAGEKGIDGLTVQINIGW